MARHEGLPPGPPRRARAPPRLGRPGAADPARRHGGARVHDRPDRRRRRRCPGTPARPLRRRGPRPLERAQLRPRAQVDRTPPDLDGRRVRRRRERRRRPRGRPVGLRVLAPLPDHERLVHRLLADAEPGRACAAHRDRHLQPCLARSEPGRARPLRLTVADRSRPAGFRLAGPGIVRRTGLPHTGTKSWRYACAPARTASAISGS